MASQQLSMFGNVQFRNVAETLLWWLVGRTTVAKWHDAKKYRSMLPTAHKGRYQSLSRSARMNNTIVNMCSMRQLTGLMPTTIVYWMWLSLHVFLMVGASGLKPPYAGALMQVILVSVLWRKQWFRLTSYLLIPAVMLRNESVKVYELPTGFTLEATVSSSDSEITQWLLLQVSAFQPLYIILSSA